MSGPAIFDRAARRLRRDRAAAGFAEHGFLRAAMMEGLLERLDAVRRDFAEALEIGCHGDPIPLPAPRVARTDAGFSFARGCGGVQADEDHLPFADASFDLVVSAGVLDQVDDLPGALALARRVLRPDGLFLAAFVGGPSFPALRKAFRTAEAERPAPRLHPQIDVRAAGDLLVRAGFALPVADVEMLSVGYPDMFRLMADLRGAAMANLLEARSPLTRGTVARAAQAFSASAGPDGRVREQVSLIFLTGWAPDPSQPQAARRGSATASLADALRR